MPELPPSSPQKIKVQRDRFFQPVGVSVIKAIAIISVIVSILSIFTFLFKSHLKFAAKASAETLLPEKSLLGALSANINSSLDLDHQQTTTDLAPSSHKVEKLTDHRLTAQPVILAQSDRDSDNKQLITVNQPSKHLLVSNLEPVTPQPTVAPDQPIPITPQPSIAPDKSVPITPQPSIAPDKSVPVTPQPSVAPDKSVLVPPQQGIKLTLADVVTLALANNRDIKTAYLERIAQRADLSVAESKYVPSIIPSISASINRQDVGYSSSNSSQIGVGATVAVKIPTGGEFDFSWTGIGQSPTTNGSGNLITQGNVNQAFQVAFNQPLLQGFGANINQASIAIARLTERANIQGLKSTLITTITNAIVAYRTLIQAQQQAEIQRISLASAQKLLEITQAFIEAGKSARVDLVQNETNVANQKASLLSAEDALDTARLQLLNLLNIERNLNIIPIENLTITAKSLDVNRLKQLAFENRPDYLQQKFTHDMNKYNLLIAADNRRWNLDFNASYGNMNGTAQVGTAALQAKFTLSRTFGNNYAVEDSFQRNRVNLLESENKLAQLQENIDIEITNSVRNVNSSLQQVELTRQARESSEKQLENEEEKHKLGLTSTSLFQIVTYQDALVTAKINELVAKITYLNALTNLDQSLGTTLDTWGVTVESKTK